MLGVESPPPEAIAEAEVAREPTGGFDRRMLGFIVLGVNLVLILAAVVGWLLLRRRPKTDDFAIDADDLGVES